jgi:hypothetical protein
MDRCEKAMLTGKLLVDNVCDRSYNLCLWNFLN